jgi:hypothetical protein
MANSWLHWVGAKYYTIDSFIKESNEYGITRRVSINDMKRMNFGDYVYCIQKVKGANYGSVFGRFMIIGISGMNEIAVSHLKSSYDIKERGGGGTMVMRGCGFYIEGESYEIDATMPEIADILDKSNKLGLFNNDEIRPMIKGDRLEVLPQPWVVLHNIPHRQGFRLFDAKKFLAESKALREIYEDSEIKRKPKHKSQFYVDKKDIKTSQEIGGIFENVKDYKKG